MAELDKASPAVVEQFGIYWSAIRKQRSVDAKEIFMMMTWFAPLLIAFKGYSFFRAIKSSFAACLLYLIPIALGLLIISLCFLFIVLAISFIFAFIGTSASGLFSFVLSFSLIIAMAAYMALTFAIQSVTFKAIFK